MSENKKATDTPLYYPRKMRTGWCVAHEVTAAGITIERYGIHCQTYAEAYRRAEVMNRKQQVETEAGREETRVGETTGSLEPSASDERKGVNDHERKSKHHHATADCRGSHAA